MSMHLAHPSVTLSGKRKGKQKFRNAAEAQRARELELSWKELEKKWFISPENKKKSKSSEKLVYSLAPPPGRATSNHIPSKNTGEVSATLKAVPEYTGTEMIGISIIHKSCLQPVFNAQSAKDAASMRR